MGPRFWKWQGWDWREPRDWQQARLPDWLPFRPSAQRASAPALAASFSFSSRPLLPRSPASPPPRGCPSCTCRKFAAGLRAQRPAFPGRAWRRACAGTRPKGAGGSGLGDPPPGEQKAGGGGAPNFKSLRSGHTASLPASKHFLTSSLGRAPGCSLGEEGVNRCMASIVLEDRMVETSYLGRTLNLPSARGGRTDSRRNEKGY